MLLLTTVQLRRSHRLAGSLALVGFTMMSMSPRLALAADGDTEKARALFEEAGELERHGQWGAAQERLRAALKLRETPQLYYALGWALENDDKLLEAKNEYETAARLGREKNVDEVTKLATARLAELETKMPVIKVRVGGAGRGATKVVVDGREIRRGSDDVATATVNPGSHVIRVERADGALEQMAYVGRGTVRTVDVDAAEPVAGRDTPQDRHNKLTSKSTVVTKATNESNTSGNIVPWVLVSGGIAFIAAGGALLLSADSDADERDALQAKWCAATACTSGSTATRPETAEAATFRREATDAASTGNTKQTVGLVLGGTGIVAATVGAVLLLRSDKAGSQGEKRTVVTRAGITPMPGGAYATAGLSF